MEKYINIKQNYKEYQEKYKIKKRVIIEDILLKDYAELIYKYLNNIKNERWELCIVYNDNQKYENYDNQKNTKTNNIVINKAIKSFEKNEFSFYFYKILNTKNCLDYIEYNLKKLFSDNEFIDFLNYITNENLTKLNDIFISKYTKNCFLGPHCDKQNGKIAITIYLSKNWKPQYGGNLCFLNDNRTEIIETITPKFNSMALFNIPQLTGIPHFVSHNNCNQSRYTITIWYS
jgi:Rps23 Pro-64 3,4-dihydroxylase Tpa1-like proline 4-hydroxylase